MTETEWLTLIDVTRLPWDFAQHLSHRKFLLGAVAACRTVEHLLDDAERQALRVAERAADGEASAEECDAAQAVITARIPGLELSAYGAVGWAFATYPPAQVMAMACCNVIAAGGPTPRSSHSIPESTCFAPPQR